MIGYIVFFVLIAFVFCLAGYGLYRLQKMANDDLDRYIDALEMSYRQNVAKLYASCYTLQKIPVKVTPKSKAKND